MSYFLTPKTLDSSEIEISLTKEERELLFNEAEKLKENGFLEDSAFQYYKCLRNLTSQDVFPSLPKCLKALALYFFEKQNYLIAIQLVNALKLYYKSALNEASLIHEKITEFSLLNEEYENKKLKLKTAGSSKSFVDMQKEKDLLQKENKELDFDFQYLTSLFAFKFEETDQASNSPNQIINVQSSPDVCMLINNLTAIGDTENFSTVVQEQSSYLDVTRDSNIESNINVTIENQGDNPLPESNSEDNSTRRIIGRLISITGYMILMIIGITIIIYAMEFSFVFLEPDKELSKSQSHNHQVMNKWKLLNNVKEKIINFPTYFTIFKQSQNTNQNSNRFKNFFNK